MAMANPFSHFQSRYWIFGGFSLTSFGVGIVYFWLSQLNWLPWPQTDPLSTPVLFIGVFGILCAALYRHCRRIGLRLADIFGPFPVRFAWWYLVLLVISILLFSFSSFVIVFYPRVST
jgi:hypothetical protein